MEGTLVIYLVLSYQFRHYLSKKGLLVKLAKYIKR